MGKNSFVLSYEHHEIVDALTDEQAGRLFKAIFCYEKGNDPDLDGEIKLAFIPIRQWLDKNKQSYEKTCVARSAAGERGGRPKKQMVFPESKKSKCFSEKAKKAEYEYEYEYEYEPEYEYESDCAKAQNTRAVKTRYADFVSMTNDEYASLVTEFGESATKRCIEILDNYKGSSGKKYKSDYRTIKNWVIERYKEEAAKDGGNARPKGNSGAYSEGSFSTILED